MKGVLEPTDYRESSTGFPFEIHKSRAGNGSEPERLKWLSSRGTSGRLRPALQTRRAQLALKGCPGQTPGPGSAFFFGFDSPQTLGGSLVPCFGGWGGVRVGGGEGWGVSFCFSPRVELQRVSTPKNQCCLVDSGLAPSSAMVADSQTVKKNNNTCSRDQGAARSEPAAGAWAARGGWQPPFSSSLGLRQIHTERPLRAG